MKPNDATAIANDAPTCQWGFLACNRPATSEVYNEDTGETRCLCAEHLNRACLAAGSPWQEC